MSAKTPETVKVKRTPSKKVAPKKDDFITRVKKQIASDKNGKKTFGWYQSKIKQVVGAKPTQEDVEGLDKLRKKHYTGLVHGRIYFFGYDAKYKDKLPYFDRFPLSIIIDISKDHILGLNLHYLPFKYRLIFIEKLEDFLTNPKNDEKERYALTYGLVKNFSRYPEVKPMIKKYLKSHVKGRLVEIAPSELIIAAMLPVASFNNNNQLKVWEDSLNKMGY